MKYTGSIFEMVEGLVSGNAQVPCGDCSACCRSSMTVKWDHNGKEIPKKSDGSCVHLDDMGKCSIYWDRPKQCRAFDCRLPAFAQVTVLDSDMADAFNQWTHIGSAPVLNELIGKAHGTLIDEDKKLGAYDISKLVLLRAFQQWATNLEQSSHAAAAFSSSPSASFSSDRDPERR